MITDFERDFPSVCFALATGIGKTRLMGAFITYMYLAHGARNFFVLAPNLTIYSKLIADFTPNTPKYVFRGVAEFATEPPQVITGDNYDATLLDQLSPCRINTSFLMPPASGKRCAPRTAPPRRASPRCAATGCTWPRGRCGWPSPS